MNLKFNASSYQILVSSIYGVILRIHSSGSAEVFSEEIPSLKSFQVSVPPISEKQITFSLGCSRQMSGWHLRHRPWPKTFRFFTPLCGVCP